MIVAGVVVSPSLRLALPVRPPLHRPVGWREKRDRDREYDRKRDPVVRKLYRSRRWQAERLAFLREQPLCVDCEAHGVIRPANVVDHIDPHRGDEAVFWDTNRWQALCASCHSRKTAKSDGGFGNPQRSHASR